MTTRVRSQAWLQTYTGRRFFPFAPDSADIAIEDIAHALALKCRFNGHCRSFYSVAQHSVIVSQLVPREDAREGLLHDAAEAYIPDVIFPVKEHLEELRNMEHAIETEIARRYGTRFPRPASVKAADLRVLAAEREFLLTPCDFEWITLRGIEHELVAHELIPWSPAEAECKFMDRFAELFS